MYYIEIFDEGLFINFLHFFDADEFRVSAIR